MMYSVEELELLWDMQADAYNRWDDLGVDEIVAFAQEMTMQWYPIETIPEDRQVLVKFPCMRREVPSYVVSCWHDPDLSNGRGLVNTFGELSLDTADADGWMEVPDI